MKKVVRWAALLLTVVMIIGCLAGCGILDEESTVPSSNNNSTQNSNNSSTDNSVDSNSSGTQDKGLLDDLIDSLFEDESGSSSNNYSDTVQDSGDDILTSLFDAFFGGSSSDYGWGDSSYSDGGHTNSSFDYADISSVPAGNGKATIMVYIIGSNLETDGGCATMDIQEMCEANIGENVNLIIEAGGSKKWQNSVMKSGKVGRYRVIGDGIAELENRGRVSMVEPSEVLDFINFSVKNYPADRYGFIFWDHGGGTMAGFGTDELFDGDLTLDEFSEIFSKSGVNFDFIGFDACLMGTIETAYSLSKSAKYFIGAEEEEPGLGWSYTGWLKALTKNPSLDIPTLGSIIVDDFVAANGRDDVTLSVIDLSKIENVYKKLCDLCAKGNEQLYAGNYRNIAKARKNTKNYGEGNFDQIDIIDFCNKCGIEGADALVKAVNEAVVYHKTNIGGTNGLAMYFPYDYPSYYKSMSKVLKSFGMNDAKATGFFSNFLSAKAGGSCSRAMMPIAAKTGYDDGKEEEDLTLEEWFNEEIASENDVVNFDLNEEGYLDLTEKGEGYVLEISEEQWDAVSMIDLGVYLDTGEGFISLGNDNAYECDEDQNIIIDFDYSWVALNGLVVPYYAVEEGYTADGSWYTYGIVKAILTSKRTGEQRDIDILLYWDDDNQDGYVKGYRNSIKGDGPAQAERSIVSFIKGDKIQFICEYYSYDGEYDDSCLYGEEIVVDSPLTVSYEEVEDYYAEVTGHVKDIYGNDYYTETVSLTSPQY